MSETLALVGHTGFVGTHLHLACNFTHTYNSRNIGDIQHRTFDRLVIAAPSAEKWKTNNDPYQAMCSLIRLIDNLATCTVQKRVVLISTIDVYGKPMLETGACEYDAPVPDCAYGKQHYILEMACESLFGNKLVVVRLPALFGLGLKKNALYDMLNNNRLDYVVPSSVFKVVHIDDAVDFIKTVLMSSDRKNTLINYFPKQETTISTIQSVFPYKPTGIGPPAIYRAESCILNGPEYHLEDYKLWIAREWMKQHLFLSPITVCDGMSRPAWFQSDFQQKCACLGVGGIGLAPTLWHPWDAPLEVWDKPVFASMKHMQSISYGLDFPICSYQFVEHYAKVLRIAERIGGIKTITLGSPSARKAEDTLKDIVRFLNILVAMTPSSIKLCLEANPSDYGAFWGNTPESMCDILREVPGIWWTLDTGCWEMMAPEANLADVAKGYPRLGHVHIALPHLKEITRETLDRENIRILAETLAEINYDGDISIEQKSSELENGKLVEAVNEVAMALMPLYTSRVGMNVRDLRQKKLAFMRPENLSEDGEWESKVCWSRPLSDEEYGHGPSRLFTLSSRRLLYLEAYEDGKRELYRVEDP